MLPWRTVAHAGNARAGAESEEDLSRGVWSSEEPDVPDQTDHGHERLGDRDEAGVPLDQDSEEDERNAVEERSDHHEPDGSPGRDAFLYCGFAEVEDHRERGDRHEEEIRPRGACLRVARDGRPASEADGGYEDEDDEEQGGHCASEALAVVSRNVRENDSGVLGFEQ